MKFDEVLRRFSAFFEAEGIRYALAGGNALLAWGLQRLTHDVDFAIDGTRRDEILAHAESLGYETTFVSEGYSNHHHPDGDFGHIDFLYLYGQTADVLFSGASRRSTLGVELPVLRPEHLIAMKVHAMKTRPMRVLIDAPDIAYDADPFAGLDFDRDMPLTSADLEALARSRNLRPLSAKQYQDWVDLIVKHHGRVPHQTNTEDDEPFTL